jgi:aquaporin Z
MTTKPDNTGAFRKYVTEFVGTFFLLMAITMSVSGGAGQFAPIAIGSMLTVMVYAGGHISGAHYNPAVSLAIYLRGKLNAGDLVPYMVAQFLSLIAELLGTIALVYVILNVATARRSVGNSYFGLAIGFTVMAGAYAFGSISGGAFNPAVALGITMASYTSWSSIWIFIVANFAGGALATFLFQYVNGPEL